MYQYLLRHNGMAYFLDIVFLLQTLNLSLFKLKKENIIFLIIRNNKAIAKKSTTLFITILIQPEEKRCEV